MNTEPMFMDTEQMLKELKERVSALGEELKKDSNLGALLKSEFSELKRALRQFDSPVTVITTVGMLKAGKSTLVNLFASSPLASPVGFGEDTTMRPALIRMAEQSGNEKIVCYFLRDAAADQPEEQRFKIFDYYRGLEATLPKGVYTEEHSLNPKILRDCLCLKPSDGGTLKAEPVLVVVETPYQETPCLLSGQQCMLLDLPGLDSGHAELVQQCGFLRVVEECDIVLFVQSSVSPLNDAARKMLAEIFRSRNTETSQIVHNEIRAKVWRKREIQDEEQRQQANKACAAILRCLPPTGPYGQPKWNCVNLGMAYDASMGNDSELNDKYVFDDGARLSKDELKSHSLFFDFEARLQETMRQRGRYYRFIHCRDKILSCTLNIKNKLEKFIVTELDNQINKKKDEIKSWQSVKTEVNQLVDNAVFSVIINTNDVSYSPKAKRQLKSELNDAIARACRDYPDVSKTSEDEIKGSYIDNYLMACSQYCCDAIKEWCKKCCNRGNFLVDSSAPQTLSSILCQEINSFFDKLNRKRESGFDLNEYYSKLPRPVMSATSTDIISLVGQPPVLTPCGNKYPYRRTRRGWFGIKREIKYPYTANSKDGDEEKMKDQYIASLLSDVQGCCLKDLKTAYKESIDKDTKEIRERIDKYVSNTGEDLKKMQTNRTHLVNDILSKMKEMDSAIRELKMEPDVVDALNDVCELS